MKHIIMYSGGLGSWYTAKLVIEKYGKEDVILLFTNTKIEDIDLYNFLHETTNEMGVDLEILSDGRNIWEVFKDVKFIGNTRIDPCSRILKRELADRWIKSNFKPDECILYFGIDWTEMHRYERLKELRKPYVVDSPLIDTLMVKNDLIKELKRLNITLPRLYKMGFVHNNCGGFCVKAGQGHFKLLYDKLPDYYRHCEEEEQRVYDVIGKTNPFLRKTIDNKLNYFTLRQFREQFIERQNCLVGDEQIDLFDIGGCDCFA